jgi:glycopeptide antibiotics resistance protein
MSMKRFRNLLTVVYLLALLKVTLFKYPLEQLRPVVSNTSWAAIQLRIDLGNFMPFETIGRYLSRLDWRVAQLNLFGNILIFIPFGILGSQFRKTNSWQKIFVVGLSASLMIECIQLLTGLGSFDVDDLILNTLGTLMGYFISKRIERAWQKG